jgi:hypothetical protein
VPVNSKYADPLETPEPIEVAHVFSRLESQILAFVRDLVEVEAERGASSEQNLQLCSRLEKTRQALHDVHTGTHQLSVGYLKDLELLPAWVVAAKAHRELFTSAFDSVISSSARRWWGRLRGTLRDLQSRCWGR